MPRIRTVTDSEVYTEKSTVFEPVFEYMEEQEPFISVFEINESIADEPKQNIYE